MAVCGTTEEFQKENMCFKHENLSLDKKGRKKGEIEAEREGKGKGRKRIAKSGIWGMLSLTLHLEVWEGVVFFLLGDESSSLSSGLRGEWPLLCAPPCGLPLPYM